MSEERIAELPCWRGGVRIEPLGGGITNRNFVVDDDAGRWVARIAEDLRALGIDRANELACQRAAAALGIAPAIVYHEPGVLVSEFVEGRTLTPQDVREPAVIERLAKLLRQLHDARDLLVGEFLYFCPFQTVRTYAETARRLGARLPARIDELLDDSRVLSLRVRPFRPSLCHDDLLAANILEAGDRLWLVDWEYGGMGNALFDVAGVAGNCAFDPATERRLLDAYLDSPSPDALAVALDETKILKAVSLLREALWAVIQGAISRIEFDYSAYARDNLAAYEHARAQLERAR